MDRDAAIAQLVEVRERLDELVEGRWHDRWSRAAFERYDRLARLEEELISRLGSTVQPPIR